MEKTEIFKVGITVKGIKKRCRKEDLHYLNLEEIPFGTFDFEAIKARAIDKVSRFMREWKKMVITFDHRTLMDHGDGVVIESHVFNSDKHQAKEVLNDDAMYQYTQIN